MIHEPHRKPSRSIKKISLTGLGFVLLLISACARSNGGSSPVATADDHVPPINRGGFSASNGEGYSGPSFVFDLVTDPKTDVRMNASRISEAYGSCMQSGSFTQKKRGGLLPAALRLVGQIYGVDMSPEFKKQTETHFLNQPSFMAAPFPTILIDNDITGVRGIAPNQIEIDDFSNHFRFSLLNPDTNQFDLFKISSNLPFFIATPANVTFTSKGEPFKKWFVGSVLTYPGETSRIDDPVLLQNGSTTPYIFNAQDLFECMLGQSQLMSAEGTQEGSKNDDVAYDDETTWFFQQFQGSYRSEIGTLNLTGDGKVDFDVIMEAARIGADSHTNSTKRVCHKTYQGKIEKAYIPMPTEKLDHLDYNGAEVSGSHLRLTVYIDQVGGAPLSTTKVDPASCEYEVYPALALGGYAMDERTANGSATRSLHFEWPVTATSADGFQVSTGGYKLNWQKSDTPVVASQIPTTTRRTDMCEVLNEWTENRWNKRLPEAKTVTQRVALYKAEYRARRHVAVKLFDLYMRTGKLDRSIFEDCLKANGERQNFLDTVSVVFWEETVKRWKTLQSKTNSTELAAFLNDLELSKDRRFPLFRMTGHNASLSDNSRMGGVLQGAPSLFLNAIDLNPNEWMMIWLHEASHYLDRKLEKSSLESATLAAAFEKNPDSISEAAMDHWVKASLDRSFWAEHRAWSRTFKIYAEIKPRLTSKIPWMEAALSFRGANESVDAYTFRLLRELNGENLKRVGPLKDDKWYARAKAIVDHSLQQTP